MQELHERIFQKLYTLVMIAVITTLHKKEDAVRIGRGLLEKRLIACYNLWPIESAYWWKGKIQEGPETMMLMKTKVRWFDEIADYIREQSGYEVPEVIAFDTEKVDLPYQAWVNEEVQ